MAQFDISLNNNPSSKADVSYLMDIQSDPVSILETRIVVPLRKAVNFSNKIISRIHISINIDNKEYIAFISELAAIPSSMIGSTVANGVHMRAEIISAIDLLFTGF